MNEGRGRPYYVWKLAQFNGSTLNACKWFCVKCKTKKTNKIDNSAIK